MLMERRAVGKEANEGLDSTDMSNKRMKTDLVARRARTNRLIRAVALTFNLPVPG